MFRIEVAPSNKNFLGNRRTVKVPHHYDLEKAFLKAKRIYQTANRCWVGLEYGRDTIYLWTDDFGEIDYGNMVIPPHLSDPILTHQRDEDSQLPPRAIRA